MKIFIVKLIGFYFNFLSLFYSRYAAKKALTLFSTPRKGKITEAQSDFLNTALIEELLYKDNVIMTYRWLGKKQTILFVHGWESNSARWKKTIKPLHKLDYNIIALDAPAHGNSGSSFFNALLYAEFINVVVKKFNPSIFIGHSVGGMATVFSYHQYKFNTIKKMVLLGTPSELKDVFKRYVEMMSYNKSIERQIKQLICERFGKSPEDFSTAKFLEDATFEGLIIHDEKDSIIPYTDALLINKSFKNSQLITTQNLGHSLKNEAIRNHIIDFIIR
ncbi:MAG: alpha/beta hydrolase [Bacteroidetes bacterium]|nr:MAG: alpha/beta hydrolase [Bacteroidota bacterium]